MIVLPMLQCLGSLVLGNMTRWRICRQIRPLGGSIYFPCHCESTKTRIWNECLVPIHKDGERIQMMKT